MTQPAHSGPTGTDDEAPRTLWRHARRVAVAVIGLTVILFGVALLVLPGPGLLVMFAGLSILALEFAWARRWVKKAREKAAQVTRRNKPPSVP